ncbi:MAG: thiamine pyrophosphate-dependent dehydrogenase E1 component subunit alpha [Pseudomonadota bacterium]
MPTTPGPRPMSAPPASAGANFDRDGALALLTMMERIRAFEEQAMRAADEKLVLGAIHPSIGQEGVAAGVMSPLRRDDVMLSTHRGHGHTLAKGADALAMMRELLGREGGACGGKGGSMHIADFGVGMLGANGVVGANIVIAAGAAHGVKLRGEDKVVVCLFGDGAANRGPFLEGLNWAAVFGLPILFVCEDNRYSATTLTADATAGPGPAARAESLGLTAHRLDGNDVLAVEALAKDAAARLRAGGGPEFIHAVTYRQTGHTSFDPAAYRPEGEAADMRASDDPVARLRAALALAGEPEAALDAVHAAAQSEMIEVYEAAKATGWPALDRAFADTQDVGDPRVEAY